MQLVIRLSTGGGKIEKLGVFRQTWKEKKERERPAASKVRAAKGNENIVLGGGGGEKRA